MNTQQRIGILILVWPYLSSSIYAFQNNPGDTKDAEPDEASNRIVWREGAPGVFALIRGRFEYKYLRYKGKLLHAHLQLWGFNTMVGYVGVQNGSDATYTLDTRYDISVQLTSPKRALPPLETEKIARLLEKQSGKNKEIAKGLRKTPWKLGPTTIPGNGMWEELFYFALEEPFAGPLLQTLPHVDLQVYLDGMAFVFPFKL